MKNGENGVFLKAITLKETARGWARFTRKDFESFERVRLDEIIFSQQVKAENGEILKKLLNKEKFTNPKEI